MKLTPVSGVAMLLLAGAAIAHEGVKNPAVMTRMNGMSAIADNMKIIAVMSKGAEPFNVDEAQQALASIAFHASQTPALFEANEQDPKSEAKPEIWTNFDDFTSKAVELESLANQLTPTIEKQDDLRNAVFLLGANCKSCHEAYKE